MPLPYFWPTYQLGGKLKTGEEMNEKQRKANNKLVERARRVKPAIASQMVSQQEMPHLRGRGQYLIKHFLVGVLFTWKDLTASESEQLCS